MKHESGGARVSRGAARFSTERDESRGGNPPPPPARRRPPLHIARSENAVEEGEGRGESGGRGRGKERRASANCRGVDFRARL